MSGKPRCPPLPANTASVSPPFLDPGCQDADLANRHLARLYGRYLLRRKSTGELELDLELNIVDSWQGEVARDTRTLSGGESFLVSLVLPLSDLLNHKTSISTLLLNEGFGTLDGEMLAIALNALDNLNASGKIFGLISHLEGLKERIAAQRLIFTTHIDKLAHAPCRQHNSRERCMHREY